MEQTKNCMMITGASRGLGGELAIEAAKQGYPLALIARGEKDLSDLGEYLNGLKLEQQVSLHFADLSNTSQIQDVFKAAVNTHGKIGSLINNAATWTGGTKVVDLTRDKLQESLDLNFYSAFNTCKEFLTQLTTDHATFPMAVVNVGATASTRGGANVFAFAGAKSLLRIFSQSMARELGPRGVHIAHVIIDGLLNNDRTLKLNPDKKENQYINQVSLSEDIIRIVEQEKVAGLSSGMLDHTLKNGKK